MLDTSPRVILPSMSASQACLLAPFSTAVWSKVAAIAQMAPPPSPPAGCAAFARDHHRPALSLHEVGFDFLGRTVIQIKS